MTERPPVPDASVLAAEVMSMRRVFTALVPLALLVMLAAGGAVVAEARAAAPTVEVKRTWIVARGAGAEAAFDITCQPGGQPVVFGAELAQDEFSDTWASGEVYDVECTGAPTRVVVPLTLTTGSPIAPGAWVVRYSLNSCIDRGECDTVGGRRYQDLQARRFVTPYDDDVGAELRLRRARLTLAGDVRVVYALTCDSGRELPFGLGSGLRQVQGSEVVGGSGRSTKYDDEGVFFCGPRTQRLGYTIAPPEGAAFRPRQAFLDSEAGLWHNWLTYATDRRAVRIAPAPDAARR
jgi:hypothetical protein